MNFTWQDLPGILVWHRVENMVAGNCNYNSSQMIFFLICLYDNLICDRTGLVSILFCKSNMFVPIKKNYQYNKK